MAFDGSNFPPSPLSECGATVGWARGYDEVGVDTLVYSEAEMESIRVQIRADYGANESDKVELDVGYLVVTKAPCNVSPNNYDDDLCGIQQAVYDAMCYQAVCIFPAGIYRVSGQISCPMPAILKSGYSISNPRADIFQTSNTGNP